MLYLVNYTDDTDDNKYTKAWIN